MPIRKQSIVEKLEKELLNTVLLVVKEKQEDGSLSDEQACGILSDACKCFPEELPESVSKRRNP